LNDAERAAVKEFFYSIMLHKTTVGVTIGISVLWLLMLLIVRIYDANKAEEESS
jgi:hypothetical protein